MVNPTCNIISSFENSVDLDQLAPPESTHFNNMTQASRNLHHFASLHMCLVARKPDFVAFEQQRCKPACASEQSDQHLCYSLSSEYDGLSCYMPYFNILASLCS